MQDTGVKYKFDVYEIRKDFPILGTYPNGKPLIYLDNAATSQKPASVINAITDYYSNYNANIHRGVYSISIKASEAYDNARKKIKEFINAASEKEIIFTRGTTESINLIAYSYGLNNISEGDEIVISGMEHHANIVPWQVLCAKKKAVLKVIPVKNNGELIIEEYKKINTRFTDENLTLIEKRFNAIKNKDTKAADSLSAKQDSNTKRKYLFATNFALNNRDFEVAPYIALSEIYDINVKYLDTIQKSMSPKVAKSLYGKKLTEYVTSIKNQK